MSSLNFRGKVFIRFILFVFIFSTILTIVPTQAGYADDQTTKLRRGLLAYAQGKSVTELGEMGIDMITVEELRILGVLASNFFHPWETRFDVTKGFNEGINVYVSDDVLVGLGDALMFDKDLAAQIAGVVVASSIESAQSLSLHYVKNGKSVYKEKDNVTYPEFLSYVDAVTGSSSFKDMVKTVKDGDPRIGADGVALMWGDNTVFDAKFGTVTASVAAYAMIHSNMDYGRGFGSSATILDDIGQEGSTEEDTLRGYLSKERSADEKAELFPYTWQMKVDCFGNLLVEGLNFRYVLLPASANPYAWYKDGGSPGESLVLTNGYSIAQLSLSNQGVSGNQGRGYTFNLRGKGESLFDVGEWRLVVGSPTVARDATVWWSFWGLGDKNKDLLDELNSITAASKYSYVPGFSASIGFWDWLGTVRLPFPKWGNVKNLMTADGFVWTNAIDTVAQYDSLGRVATTGSFSTTSVSSLVNKLGNKPDMGRSDIRILDPVDSRAVMEFLYVTYIFTMTGDINPLGFRYNKDAFPDVNHPGINITTITDTDSDARRDALFDSIEDILSPTGTLLASIIDNTIGKFMLNQHYKMVGDPVDNKLVSSTRYVGFSGYVTTPQLSDIEWFDRIIRNYDTLVLYASAIMALVLLGYIIVGSITFQRAVVSLFLFVLCVLLPPYLIDGIIGVSNRVTNSIYGDKFIYWGISQHQGYLSDVEQALSAQDSDEYFSVLFRHQQNENRGRSLSTTLKWMTPKKHNFSGVVKEVEETTGYSSRLLQRILQSNHGFEYFVENPNALYLYRSYLDIANHAQASHKAVTDNGGAYFNNFTSMSITGHKKSELQRIQSYITSKTGLKNAIDLGFNNNSDEYSGGSFSYTKARRFTLPLSNRDSVMSAISYGTSLDKLNLNSSVGIDPDKFGITVADINTLSGNVGGANTLGLFSFGLATESPFYYFSWSYYDQGMGTDFDSNRAVEDLFLRPNGDFFYNNKTAGSMGEGYLKDFTDVRSLFNVVIPYLRMANDVVTEWDDLYGMYLHTGVPDSPTDDYGRYQKWHNEQVERLWGLYSPWVATMYASSYAEPETIRVVGEPYTVVDPLDPNSYPGVSAGRPMIFSESEMRYYGLESKDLTKVERKILEFNSKTYTSLYKMNNYMGFADPVINTASAMLTTFNFNQVFSDPSLFTDTSVMYPQAFELKNFSYDGFLRMILSNAVGVPLYSEDDLYTSIVDNSSFFASTLLVINDFLSIYVISGVKLFFLIAILIMSILVIVTSTIKIDVNIGKTIINSMLVPLLQFLFVTIAHAMVVSWFMEDGLTGVTGSDSINISLGDPTLTLFAFCVIHIVVVILYYKISKSVAKDGIRVAKASLTSIVGGVGGALAVTGGLIAESNRLAGKVYRGVRDYRMRRGIGRLSDSMEDLKSNLGDGQSSRGVSRDSSDGGSKFKPKQQKPQRGGFGSGKGSKLDIELEPKSPNKSKTRKSSRGAIGSGYGGKLKETIGKGRIRVKSGNDLTLKK